MNRGLYIGATSLIANQRRLESLSNNLANTNTTGFKRDMLLTESFPEKLLSKINDRRIRPRAMERDITYEMDGDIHRARVDNGYFVISTPMGNSYVRDIRFTIDDEGYLRTFYQDGRDALNTDYENYIVDRGGNRLRGAGNIEALLEGAVYDPHHHVVGTMGAGIKVQKVITDFTQGDMIETGAKYDIALVGPGFFKVAGEDGNIYYTRDGSFTVDSQNRLITSRGEIVQGVEGTIYIAGEDVTIDYYGRIMVDGNMVGTLDIVDIDNREFLRKMGDSLFAMAEGVDPEEVPFQGEVLQGYLEGSNVNAINEMVEMITLLRDFEAGQRAIRVQDEMLEKSANEIARV
ncbi:MAG: flagellar hook-basal body protein [Tissierellia bacterium]|nr:flagellar hook-basal body protein [Tissierellia bacterium]